MKVRNEIEMSHTMTTQYLTDLFFKDSTVTSWSLHTKCLYLEISIICYFPQHCHVSILVDVFDFH